MIPTVKNTGYCTTCRLYTLWRLDMRRAYNEEHLTPCCWQMRALQEEGKRK